MFHSAFSFARFSAPSAALTASATAPDAADVGGSAAGGAAAAALDALDAVLSSSCFTSLMKFWVGDFRTRNTFTRSFRAMYAAEPTNTAVQNTFASPCREVTEAANTQQQNHADQTQSRK